MLEEGLVHASPRLFCSLGRTRGREQSEGGSQRELSSVGRPRVFVVTVNAITLLVVSAMRAKRVQ